MNTLSKSTIRSSKALARSLDKFAVQVAKKVNRMPENKRLNAMQVIGNIDDTLAFDAVVSANNAALSPLATWVVGEEVATGLDKVIAQFVNDERRAKAVMRSAVRGGRFANVHLSSFRCW